MSIPKVVWQTKRERYWRVWSQLQLERASFEGHWRTIADYVCPTRQRFMVMDANQGRRRNDRINDGTATLASRVLSAGMMAGMTNPATKWFHLVPADPSLAEDWQVKEWLEYVETLMHVVMVRSNLYSSLAQIYEDEGNFGTAGMFVEEDFERVFHTTVFPVGSYFIAQDRRGRINLLYRVWEMTVRQIVEEYGMRADGSIDWTNLSDHVRNLWEVKNREQWITVHQIVEPNEEYNGRLVGPKGKRYVSCTFEVGTSSAQAGNYAGASNPDRFLRESGYDHFPFLAVRWSLAGEDIYGTNCPGMSALGDIKQLQLGERRIAQAIEKLINPPLNAPESLRGSKLSVLPGDINYVSMQDLAQKFEPVYRVEPKVQELEAKQEQCRRRIEEFYFKPTFLMFSQDPERQPITAAEVAARQAEKMLQLGPVLERHTQDLYDPLIGLVFRFMLRQGIVPPPPEAMQRAPLRVEYISIMAQAQKAASLGSIERWSGFVGQLAGMKPEALDNVNIDKAVEEYAERAGVPPQLVAAPGQVAAMRAQRQQAMQAQQAAQNVPQMAQAAKNLGDTPVGQGSLLDRIVQAAKANEIAQAG